MDFLSKLLEAKNNQDVSGSSDINSLINSGLDKAKADQNIMASLPDVSGTGDINSLISSGLLQANKDKNIMDNLPDVSGTNVQNLLNTLSNSSVPFYQRQMLNIPEKQLLEQVPDNIPDNSLDVEDKQLLPHTAGPIEVQAPLKKIQQQESNKKVETQANQPSLLDTLLKGSDQGSDKEMLAAQAAAAENRRNYLLADAAAQIGAGIGRSQYNPNNLDNVKSMVDVPVTNLKDLREAASKKQKDQLTTLELAKAKLDFSDEAQRSDPKSDVSALARSSIRDALKRMGRNDLASKINDNMSGEQLNKLFGTMTLSNMVTAYEAQQNRLAMAQAKASEAKAAHQEKLNQKDVTRLDAAGKLISEDMARMNTPFGKNANLINTADRLEALISSKDPKDVTNQQIYEIARGLDGMVSMGASTIGGTTHLLPRGFMADMAVASEKVKNEPAGAGQAKFVKQAMETIRRERDIAKKQIAKAAKGALGSYMDLSTKHPEAWNTMLQMKGIDPSLINTETKSEESFSPREEAGIQAIIKNNNISREEAIKALKAAGKL